MKREFRLKGAVKGDVFFRDCAFPRSQWRYEALADAERDAMSDGAGTSLCVAVTIGREVEAMAIFQHDEPCGWKPYYQETASREGAQ